MNRYATVAILAFLIALPRIAYAQRPTPPPVPTEIEVPTGYRPFLVGHAVGTQGYVCVAVGKAFRWTPFGPHATLFNHEGRQQSTHFLDPTPYSLLPNPAWQHSRDSSVVWGQPIGSSSDPNFVGSRCDPMAASPGRCRRRGAHGRQHADGHAIHPTPEHDRWHCAVDGMCRSSGYHETRARAV